MKKYFNPLKPDSARIVYEILPLQYADPDIEPNPLKMEVEIRDCDSNVVRNDVISETEQRNQVYWWDGKDNSGRYTDPEKSPYLVDIKLNYREAKGGRQLGFINRSTNTTNAPAIIAAPILTRVDPYTEIPTDDIRYIEIEWGNSRPLYFSTVILTKEDETGIPENDYHCYHPTYSGYRVLLHDPEWDNQPVEFNVEKWRYDLLWGSIHNIRWCEIMPAIYNDDQDRVGYADSTVLGNWTGPFSGFGWGWNENQKDMSEGTLRYRVHVENRDLLGNLLQEATTPRGTDLFRVSVKGNYPTSDIVKWTSSYLGVPYVLLTYPPPNGRNIYYDPPWNDPDIKTKIAKYRKLGYEGLDCSGLAGWSYIWVGEDLDNNPATVDSVDIDNTGADLLETYYGKVNLNNQDAQDGDMWFVDIGLNGSIDHVGVFYKKDEIRYIIHAEADANDKVVNELLIERPYWINNWGGYVQGQAGLGRRPHN